MTNDFAYFCGLWVAEGSIDSSIYRLSITCSDEEVGELLESGKIFGLRFTHNRKDQWRVNSKELIELMRYIGMPLVKAPQKYIPDWVWSGKREWACEFLGGLFDGNGCIHVGNRVSYTSSSEKLTDGVQLLLSNFGVLARKTVVTTQPTEKSKAPSVGYRLSIDGCGVTKLKGVLKLRLKRKVKRLSEKKDDVKDKRHGVPHVLSLLEALKTHFRGVKLHALYETLVATRRGSKPTYLSLSNVLKETESVNDTGEWAKLNQIVQNGYLWDKVVSVDDGRCETFDFTIPDTHSFWSNGFISHNTPKAMNHLYDLYKLGQDEDNVRAHRWTSWQFPTSSSPFIPQGEIEAAKADMDERSYLQEFEASFVNMSGRVYHAFDRDKHIKNDIVFNPEKPIWIGQDFNLDPMSSVVMQPQDDGTVWVVDEIVLHGSNTEEVCDEIEKRYWRWQPKVVIFPDPAGQYGQHARGESDLDIFRERGFRRLHYHKKHPLISDRVNAVNRMLKSADGKIRLFFHPKCKGIINSLEQTIYKKGTRELDKAASVEHSADALGYCIHYQFPVRSIEIAGVSI